MAFLIILLVQVMVIFSSVYQSLSVNFNCREPDNLPMLIKTAEDITTETRWIMPQTLPDNYFNGLKNVTYEPIHPIRNCNDYIQRNFHASSEPVSTGSTCPWYFVRNIDPNRIPSVITEAECACKCCGKVNCPHKRCSISHKPKLCEKIYTYTRVLRRTGCIDGVYVYSEVIEPISVGCTCVRCQLPVTRRMQTSYFT